jgi:hypothetical protein
MRVPEEPVCTDLFWQNPVCTSLHLRSPEARAMNPGWSKLDFAERHKCKPVLLSLSLAGNLEKPLMSLYGTKWREHKLRKKKIKFSSYIRKFRRDRLQSHV